ncbi:hypothetical protein T484DRAFT_1833958, partial [Baffinella frigidus]
IQEEVAVLERDSQKRRAALEWDSQPAHADSHNVSEADVSGRDSEEVAVLERDSQERHAELE